MPIRLKVKKENGTVFCGAQCGECMTWRVEPIQAQGLLNPVGVALKWVKNGTNEELEVPGFYRACSTLDECPNRAPEPTPATEPEKFDAPPIGGLAPNPFDLPDDDGREDEP